MPHFSDGTQEIVHFSFLVHGKKNTAMLMNFDLEKLLLKLHFCVKCSFKQATGRDERRL